MENLHCLDCHHLGDSPQGQCIDTEHVFYTISPDSLRLDYSELIPDEQKASIDRRFNKFIKSIMHNALFIRKYSIHYEMNKAGNLHIHGIMLLNRKQLSTVDLIYLSKMGHKIFGRPGVPSYVSSHFRAMNKGDMDVYTRYVNKENVYPPMHIVNAPPVPVITKHIDYFKRYECECSDE